MSVGRAILRSMTNNEHKAVLHRYLSSARENLRWKLAGLSEYDARRPLTPTGTNLLGLLKHSATAAYGYFGETFARPYEDGLPWMANGGTDNGDMWATADESWEFIVGLYQRAWGHADATIEALDLDAPGRRPPGPDARADRTCEFVAGPSQRAWRHAGPASDAMDLHAAGRVPWWPDGRADVTLQAIMVHMLAEAQRHAGHADIVRESIDGAAGLSAGRSNP